MDAARCGVLGRARVCVEKKKEVDRRVSGVRCIERSERGFKGVERVVEKGGDQDVKLDSALWP